MANIAAMSIWWVNEPCNHLLKRTHFEYVNSLPGENDAPATFQASWPLLGWILLVVRTWGTFDRRDETRENYSNFTPCGIFISHSTGARLRIGNLDENRYSKVSNSSLILWLWLYDQDIGACILMSYCPDMMNWFHKAVFLMSIQLLIIRPRPKMTEFEPLDANGEHSN